MKRYIWLTLGLAALFGCAERRKFWKEVDQDRTARATQDFGAGKKP